MTAIHTVSFLTCQSCLRYSVVVCNGMWAGVVGLFALLVLRGLSPAGL